MSTSTPGPRRRLLVLDEAKAVVQPARGAAVREPSLGFGSFLTFWLTHGAPGSADWYLWLYQAMWRLEAGREILAASEDDQAVAKEAVQRLDGAVLQSFALEWNQDAVLTFGDDLVLRTFRVHSSGYDQWMLWRPDGRVLIAGSDGWVDEARDDQPPSTPPRASA